MDQTSQYAHGVRSDEPRSEALRPEARASRQDIFLFTAPPVLSALVLAALCVHLPRIPSAHPLTDAVLLCAGISAVLITSGGLSASSAPFTRPEPSTGSLTPLNLVCRERRAFSARSSCVASF